MKCSDLQFELSLYRDGGLVYRQDAAVRTPIEICPQCRQRVSDYNEIGAALRSLSVPEMPSKVRDRINAAVIQERNAGMRYLPAPDVREWLTMRLMPYCVGLAASVFIGFSFLTMMYSGALQPETAGRGSYATESGFLLANNGISPDGDDPITPLQFADTRRGFGPESPSVNPSGALVELTRTLVNGGMNDDEVVVVADVFENGLAQITEVVEPSHNSTAVAKLQKALQTDPSYSPFIPANIEARPRTVRVVFKLQSVSVSTREPRRTNRTSAL